MKSQPSLPLTIPHSRAIAKQLAAVETAAAKHGPVKLHRRRLVRRVADLLRDELGVTWVRGHYRTK